MNYAVVVPAQPVSNFNENNPYNLEGAVKSVKNISKF